MMSDSRDERGEEQAQDAASRLRLDAEERVGKLGPASDDLLQPESAAAEVHELRVHQIELEMQNEELRAAQLQLDEQREKYFDLFNQAPVGYLIVSSDGTIAEANLTGAYLLGAERHELVGKPLSALVFAEDRDSLYLHRRMLERTGGPQTFELRLQRGVFDSQAAKDPSYFWARLEYRVHQAAEAEMHPVWVTFTDIDERRREKEKLTYVMKAVESASDAIGISDASGHHIFQNRAMTELFGYDTPQELEQAGGGRAVIKDPEVAKEMYDSIESGVSWAGELDMVTKHGHVFPAYERADAITDEHGRTIGLIGVITDVTERRRIETELSRERALLVQAEAIGGIGSWRAGSRDSECRWSAQTVLILGFDPTPYGSGGIEALRSAVHSDSLDDFDQWILAASASSEPAHTDFKLVLPDGDVRWIRAHAAGEGCEDGTCATLAGILFDVTDVKQIEQERVEHLEEVANVDRLTGLHNLRGFELLAEQAMAQAKRANQGFGVIFCDVDGLKKINDEFGHAQGDRALQDVASILTFTLRSADALARIGGDEFVVLAVGADRSAIVRLNERLQEGFDFFNATTARPYRVFLSSGTAWSEPGENRPFEQLEKIADKAMYAEKERRSVSGE